MNRKERRRLGQRGHSRQLRQPERSPVSTVEQGLAGELRELEAALALEELDNIRLRFERRLAEAELAVLRTLGPVEPKGANQ